MLQTWKNKKAEPTAIETEVTRLHEVLKNHLPHSPEYAATLDQLVKLEKLNSEITSKKRVSPDTLANGAVNLVGIVMILKHEWAHVIGSKAMSFVKSVR